MRGRRALEGICTAAAAAAVHARARILSGRHDPRRQRLAAGEARRRRPHLPPDVCQTASATRRAGSGSRATTPPSPRTVRASSHSVQEKVASREGTAPSSLQTPSSSSTTRICASRCRSASRSAGCTSPFPRSKRMHGISILGHEVTLTRLTIDGSPLTDVRIGAGTKGSGGMSGRIALTDSTLSGGVRDVVSVFGPVGLRVEGNVLSGARGKTRPRDSTSVPRIAASRHSTSRSPVTRSQPTAGPGSSSISLPQNGLPVLASGIEIARNEILGNAREAPRERRGGIVIAGRQNDGKGQILVHENFFHGNRGPDVLRRQGRRGCRCSSGPGAFRRRRPARSATTPHGSRARLDAVRNGTIFLPRLPNGECYATRGLWVSRDGTTITSDGACIVSLGLGPVRLHSTDGDPIAASAVFFVNRSKPTKPAPVHVTISNLRIVVPEGQSMYGVARLRPRDHSEPPRHRRLAEGRRHDQRPRQRQLVCGRHLDPRLDAQRGRPQRDLRDGRDRAAHRGQHDRRRARLSARVSPRQVSTSSPTTAASPRSTCASSGNTISDNAGPGILLELEPNDGAAVARDRARDQRQHDRAELREANAAEAGRDRSRRRAGRRRRNAAPQGQRHPGQRRPRHPEEPAQAWWWTRPATTSAATRRRSYQSSAVSASGSRRRCRAQSAAPRPARP